MSLLRRSSDPEEGAAEELEADIDPELAIHRSRTARAVERANAAVAKSKTLRESYAEAEQQRQGAK